MLDQASGILLVHCSNYGLLLVDEMCLLLDLYGDGMAWVGDLSELQRRFFEDFLGRAADTGSMIL